VSHRILETQYSYASQESPRTHGKCADMGNLRVSHIKNLSKSPFSGIRIPEYGDSDAELASKPSIPLRILELYAYLCTQWGLEKVNLVQPELHDLGFSGCFEGAMYGLGDARLLENVPNSTPKSWYIA